jgi:hypothetical protein
VFVQPAERRENLAGNYRPRGAPRRVAVSAARSNLPRLSDHIVLPRRVLGTGSEGSRPAGGLGRSRLTPRGLRRSSDHIVVMRRGGLRALAAGDSYARGSAVAERTDNGRGRLRAGGAPSSFARRWPVELSPHNGPLMSALGRTGRWKRRGPQDPDRPSARVGQCTAALRFRTFQTCPKDR